MCIRDRAYAALTGPIGERMAKILGIGAAETAPRCLACHAVDVPQSERGRTFELSEGVSCESCHGPAAGWLGPHTERDWTHQKSLALGMYDTRDLTKRSEKCLSCHLGSDEKSVDHEMIAAGHPDLFFELDTFSDVMPRHWKEPGEPGEAASTDPWYNVRELTSGQAVQLRQSLLRLASRSHGKIWPEYSELQCYACHHSLTPPEQSWRQARGYPGRRPGNPPWNPSRYAVFRDVVHQLDGENAEKLDSELSRLGQLMSQLNPDRDAVELSLIHICGDRNFVSVDRKFDECGAAHAGLEAIAAIFGRLSAVKQMPDGHSRRDKCASTSSRKCFSTDEIGAGTTCPRPQIEVSRRASESSSIRLISFEDPSPMVLSLIHI